MNLTSIYKLEVRDGALKALEEAKTRGIDNPLDAEIVLVDSDGPKSLKVIERFATRCVSCSVISTTLCHQLMLARIACVWT